MICKMSVQHKSISPEKASRFGGRLRQVRSQRELTLVGVSSELGIDVGQLSRFERGQFVRASKNLQKYANYLQVNAEEELPDSLAERLMVIAARSVKHREAVEEIVTALERIG
jgi:transcriptional regulator with XRE-family HTH domain